MTRACSLGLVVLALLGSTGCRSRQHVDPQPAPEQRPASSRAIVSPAPGQDPGLPATPPRRESVTIVAAGDISFGREVGQILLRNPSRDFFGAVAPWLQTGDIRFANLESQLTDRRGETQSPVLKLAFAGPPAGADALSRAGFDIVSTANNHMWDYGKNGLFETMDNLDRVGVRHVGSGRDRDEAYEPVLVNRDGFRVAFLGVTDIWNQGPLKTHKGASYVARADRDTLVASIRALRSNPEVDAIAVSYHGGCEYLDWPIAHTKEVARAAIDAGADVVIGHHPHIVQGVEWRSDRPILYSLGNLVMRMSEGRPREGTGYVARIVLKRGVRPDVEACPYRIDDYRVIPFAGHKSHERQVKQFFDRLMLVSKGFGGLTVGTPGEDGCVPLGPSEPDDKG